jgi:putative membrane protein
VALILLVRWLLRMTKAQKTPGTEESALDILKKRYAQGEINRDEFEQKKRDIQ